MKNSYRLYRRKGIYYTHDAETGKQQRLGTRDKKEAERLAIAKNKARGHPYCKNEEKTMPSTSNFPSWKFAILWPRAMKSNDQADASIGLCREGSRWVPVERRAGRARTRR